MSDKSNEIRAAGGIVIGTGKNSGKILLVRRRRYGGEVGLPKGKLKKGEREADAALREVEEETGLRAKLRQAVGTTKYSVDGRPKTVAYFRMEASDDAPAGPKDAGEVEAVEWITPREAMKALTHDDDRKLVAKVFGLAPDS
jgi:8-oxo-dGTP pyrophosphatase MutT (NUDIX family)